MSVNGWAPLGGSELGTNRVVPNGPDFYAIARTIEKRRIDGLLIIGGWEGYQGAYRLFEERANFPAFDIPMVCLPATIDNNLPGTELSIGADTALNSIVDVVDKIKQSAVAERRCYIVEVMGRRCGYLALMSGLATGAERVYLHEEGVTLKSMKEDLDMLVRGFREGKRLGLVIRNEDANPTYDTLLHVARCSRRRAAARSPCARASSATCSRAATRRRSTGSRRPSSRAAASAYLIEQAADERPARVVHRHGGAARSSSTRSRTCRA